MTAMNAPNMSGSGIAVTKIQRANTIQPPTRASRKGRARRPSCARTASLLCCDNGLISKRGALERLELNDFAHGTAIEPRRDRAFQCFAERHHEDGHDRRGKLG